jgi:hypothetical protein
VPSPLGTGKIEWRAARPQDGSSRCEAVCQPLLSGDLILSYVPEAEQRVWRTLT